MKCSKCGCEIPEGARFCPSCGSGVEFTSGTHHPKKRSPMVYAIVVLAAIAILALVFNLLANRGNVTNAPGSGSLPPGEITNAPPGLPGNGNITNAPPGVPPPGQSTPTAVVKPKPPQQMVDYLDFVKRLEDHRQMLLKDTTNALTLAAASGVNSSLLSMIDAAMNPNGAAARDPLAETKKELNRQYKNWMSTLQYFDKKPAPSQCREFSGKYREVIFRETKAIGEIAVSFNSVNLASPQDMSKLLAALQKMKRDPTIQGNIDKAADTADASLTQLVSNYDMDKPFSVPREEKTSGSIMGF